MGSALAVRGRSVWLSYWALLRGGLGDIGWGTDDVEVGEILGDFYGPLIEHLARTHRVELQPYDWRDSVTAAARRLAERLEALLPELERTGQPVHIVAHSMGGLVARAMIADGGAGSAVWRRITALPGSRLLMLGTPNRGSHEAVRWLVGLEPHRSQAEPARPRAHRQRHHRHRPALPRHGRTAAVRRIRRAMRRRRSGSRSAPRPAAAGRWSTRPGCAPPRPPGRCCWRRRPIRGTWSTWPAASARP